MKKCGLMLLPLLAALLLCACGAAEPTWETVDDFAAAEAGSYLDRAYLMQFDVPPDAVAEVFDACGSRSVYEQPDGDYEIVSEVLLASDVGSVVRELTGFDADQLDVIQTTRYGMPEYRFAWYADAGEGGRVCRADVLTDGTYCYALCFSCREDTGTLYDSTAQSVFSSFCLQQNEGF